MAFEENVYAFLEELSDFEYNIECVDHIWKLIFPDNKGTFHSIIVTLYHDTYYVSHVDGNLCRLEVKLNKSVEAAQSFGFSRYESSHDPTKGWDGKISSARKWLAEVKKDWIKANKRVREDYPLNRRWGIISNALVQEAIPDIYRIDKELGRAKTKKFIHLVESNYFHQEKNTVRKSMTVNEFFEYCKIAYIAGKRKDDHVDENLSGRQMYERYADGRDEGLLEIVGDSPEEFSDWIDHKHPKWSGGGHPWEIKRGGNTTHINLSVSRPRYGREEDGYTVCLSGASISRLKETICMFLAIQAAGLPITINDPEGIRKRLLGQDNVGIVPCHDSLHRANQHFYEHEEVYDVLHFDEFGRAKRKVLPFINWKPLPLLKLKR